MNVHSVTFHGKTPLHVAVDKGYETIIQKLLTQKADPSLKDVLGNTSLHLAVQLKQEIKPPHNKAKCSYMYPYQGPYLACSAHIVRAIIEHGADVNAVNNRGKSALWFCLCGWSGGFCKDSIGYRGRSKHY